MKLKNLLPDRLRIQEQNGWDWSSDEFQSTSTTTTSPDTTPTPEKEAPVPEKETEQSTTVVDPSRLIDSSKIYDDVDEVVDDLDGYVNQSNVLNVYKILRKYATDSNGNLIQKYVAYNNKVYDAAQFFAWAYSIDETGDTLNDDIQSIGTKTFDTSFLMNQWPRFLEFIESINISNISQDSPPIPITDSKILAALKVAYQSIPDTEMPPMGWEFIL